VKVSAACITYGRPELLEEAIESWLRQDFSGHELVVFNTLSRQTLQFEHPNVRVINTFHRPKTLGETRNRCIEECRGEFILNFDDDDIYLPQYISWLASRVKDMDWIRQSQRWCMKRSRITGLAEQAVNSTMFRRSLWEKVGGYPHKDTGEDKVFMGKVMAQGQGVKAQCDAPEVGFIYGFGRGAYNVSACGGRSGRTCLEEVDRLLVKNRPRRGRVVLHPRWRADYWGLTRKWIDENRNL
jgi:glycosyltransferase involved in cell wall biosynthesis